MTEEIYFSIAFVLAIIAVVLKITNKDKDITGMKQRHIYMILDETCGKKEETNEDTQLCEDMSQLVSVILVSVPNQYKISVLKEIREITFLGLKEAKDIIESTPYVIKENISNSEARNIKNILEKAGAEVEIR